MSVRTISLRWIGMLGAVFGYGCLAAFLWLVGAQVHRWFRDGEWTHFGVTDGAHAALNFCCASAASFAPLMRWLESPAQWLGVHRVFEVLPASLALFALSIAGNCVFIYCRDRLRTAEQAAPVSSDDTSGGKQ